MEASVVILGGLVPTVPLFPPYLITTTIIFGVIAITVVYSIFWNSGALTIERFIDFIINCLNQGSDLIFHSLHGLIKAADIFVFFFLEPQKVGQAVNYDMRSLLPQSVRLVCRNSHWKKEITYCKES